MPDLTAHLIFWSLAVVGFALDLWTKAAVFEWLWTKPGGSVSVIDGFFRLTAVQNPGAAFGLADGHRFLLISVSIIAAVVIFAVFLFAGIKTRLTHIALGLFGAGIFGNLYDRLFNNGQVRDFIDIYYGKYHWPAFNIADSALCIGVGLLVISTLRISSEKRPTVSGDSGVTEKSSQKHVRQHK
ncbi:signal peptidase II [Planctomycetota bacterium]